jgi:hypothetical protein
MPKILPFKNLPGTHLLENNKYSCSRSMTKNRKYCFYSIHCKIVVKKYRR